MRISERTDGVYQLEMKITGRPTKVIKDKLPKLHQLFIEMSRDENTLDLQESATLTIWFIPHNTEEKPDKIVTFTFEPAPFLVASKRYGTCYLTYGGQIDVKPGPEYGWLVNGELVGNDDDAGEKMRYPDPADLVEIRDREAKIEALKISLEEQCAELDLFLHRAHQYGTPMPYLDISKVGGAQLAAKKEAERQAARNAELHSLLEEDAE